VSRLALVTVHGPEYHPNRRLLEAAHERGAALELLHPFRAWCALTGGHAGLLGADPPPVVIPRVGSTISPYTLALLRHLELMGARLVNGPSAIELASHQYLSLQALATAGLPVPDTCLVNRPEGWEAALERLGGYPVVAKLPAGRQGRGVALIQDQDQAALAQQLWLQQRRGLLVQRYLPPEGRRDLRVLVLGHEAVAGMELTPPAGEFRANVHLGGRPRDYSPGGAAAGLAVAAARALGLEVAGVDLVQPDGGPLMVMEVNFTPGFQGLEQASGRDVAGMLLEHALKGG